MCSVVCVKPREAYLRLAGTAGGHEHACVHVRCVCTVHMACDTTGVAQWARLQGTAGLRSMYSGYALCNAGIACGAVRELRVLRVSRV